MRSDAIRVGQLRRWDARWDETDEDALLFVVVQLESSGGREYASILGDGRTQVHRLGHIVAFSRLVDTGGEGDGR